MKSPEQDFPKVFYLKYDLYRISWLSLLALATYQNLIITQTPHLNGVPLPNEVNAELSLRNGCSK